MPTSARAQVPAAGAAPTLPAAGAADTAPAQPESGSGYRTRQAVIGNRYLAATANAHATRAAVDMLARGGSAVDAAIAAQMVLTLVEPQSSGIGGGAFLLVFDKARHQVEAWDGRETAPVAATQTLFQNAEGRTLGFYDAIIGGRAVGTPGVLRMLEAAHRQHGRLPWAELFAPALMLANEGFPISPRLATLLREDSHLKNDPVAAAYFFDAAGQPLPVGHRLRNPALAQTFATLATQGADAFYQGALAQAIVEKVRAHPTNPGLLSLQDLASYRPVRRDPICIRHARYRVCGMPPPSSGGIAVAQMLTMWETLAPERLMWPDGRYDARGAHVFAEAGRLAYADRDRFVADSDFVPLPGGRPDLLLDRGYLAARAQLITERSMGHAQAGDPLGAIRPARVAIPYEEVGTSHLSIIDGEGNAVAMTTTIEDMFGARQMVGGFLLNNQLSDFSFAASEAGVPLANRVQPGKRPRSSMAPTLVFETAGNDTTAPAAIGPTIPGDRLYLTLGSPGGSAIINYVARVLIATLDDGTDLQIAINAANLGSRNGPTELERGQTDRTLTAALVARRHEVRTITLTSGLHAIMQRCEAGTCRLIGAADPRREGEVDGR